MTTLHLTVNRLIEAPADQIYAIVSDVSTFGALSPENVASTWIDASNGAEHTKELVGRRFRGRNRVGWVRWTTTPVVTVAEAGHRFAFRVPMGRSVPGPTSSPRPTAAPSSRSRSGPSGRCPWSWAG